MSKIQNITQLREFALETLDRLKNGDIDLQEALAAGKVCDTVINTVKLQIDYDKVLGGEIKPIPFMLGTTQLNLLEHEEKTVKTIPYSRPNPRV
jgi:hypothetical protein